MGVATATGKLIQHWPYRNDGDTPQTCVGSDYDEKDLWGEIAQATLGDGGVLVIGLYSNDERHSLITEKLQDAGDVDLNRVLHFNLKPITRTIQTQAQPALRFALRNAQTDEIIWREIPEQPAGETQKVFDKRFCLGDKVNLKLLEAAVRDSASTKNLIKSYSRTGQDESNVPFCPITTVVMVDPNSEEGDLTFLQEFRNACPNVDVYIFHRYDETKYGVTVEGDEENWQNEFPALKDCQFEQPEVIVDDLLLAGNIHVIAGRFETYKTMALLELASAILDQRPVFDHFAVKKHYPIVFLEADMSGVLLNSYAGLFNLQKHGTDFRVSREDILHAVDSPVLQKAVDGRILILDTMLDYAQIEKAFESGEWITFMQKLRALMTNHGCIAIVMTAHASKAGAKSNSIDPSEYLKDSVTFGGKIDVAYGFRRLENSSQILIERIKGRGFKSRLQFTIAVTDDDGNSNLDRGHFPVCQKPGEVRIENTTGAGHPDDPDKKAKLEFLSRTQGTLQEVTDRLNTKFGSKHSRSTIYKWQQELKERTFDYEESA